jgi:hypothetical protein
MIVRIAFVVLTIFSGAGILLPVIQGERGGVIAGERG